MRNVFVGSKSLGSAPAVKMMDLSEAAGAFFQASFVYVSPHTGAVWASLPVMDDMHSKSFIPLLVPGPGEPSRGGYPAGSLLSAGPELIRQLPTAAIEREFWLHLNHYSKETENEVK